MEIIRSHAYARAGLLGNPSDGYGGKTISVIVPNFSARIVLYEWEHVELLLSQEDKSRFDSVEELVDDVDLHGYYGGIRLVKASIKRFVEYCRGRHELHGRKFTVRYESNIPRAVGLAGSSAIIVATFRALMEFYQIEIPRRVLPSLVLSVETSELGIAAGLQDRVIQVYEGAVYMDFSAASSAEIDGFLCGGYEELDPASLPRIYIAFSRDMGEPTEVFHNNLRARFDAGDPEIVDAMQEFAQFAAEGKSALARGDFVALHQLIDANFDKRQSICQLPAKHVGMIENARSVGACAKFAGSGGAIVGLISDDQLLRDLTTAMETIDCTVVEVG